jgi:hypothetical protein
MRSRFGLSTRFYGGFLFRFIWPCLALFFSSYIVCSQANALSFQMHKGLLEQMFHVNINEIQNDNMSLVLIENENNIGFDEKWTGWSLAPHQIYMDGAMYNALVFEEQSTPMSQVEVNGSLKPPIDIIPIPECPTLFLIGIGLVGIGVFIRYGTMKKIKRVL